MIEDIDLVKNLRRNLNITHEDLATLFDVHVTTTYRWESGTAHLSSWQRVMMKKFLDASSKLDNTIIISELLKTSGVPYTIYILLHNAKLV